MKPEKPTKWTCYGTGRRLIVKHTYPYHGGTLTSVWHVNGKMYRQACRYLPEACAMVRYAATIWERK